MKLVFKLLLVLTLTFAVFSPTQKASANPYQPYPIVFNTGWSNGFPYGYGFYNYSPFFPPALVAPYGFSYYTYYYRPSTYAAIVYSIKADKGAYSFGEDSATAAFRAAKALCAADDCAPIVWVQDGCAALAVSKTNNRIGWAYAPTRYAAQTAAMRSCRQGLAVHGCEGKAWVCTN